MIKAVIFDFDGVIADTEPVHFAAFRDVLNEEGYLLSKDEYYGKYLAYDDKTLFSKFYSSYKIELPKKDLDRLLIRKSHLYDELAKDEMKIFPGVNSFLENIKYKFRIAIGSGALKKEIINALEILGIHKYFELIISADDVEKCKPNPEVYNKVLDSLNTANTAKRDLIMASECIVIEDSIYGIEAAKKAGMRCIAVTNTYHSSDLSGADVVVERLDSLSLDMLKTD